MDKPIIFTDTETDDYMKLLTDLVGPLVDRGMKSPMTTVAVGPNGHVSCARLSLDDRCRVIQLKKLCSFPNIPDLYVPAHIMVVDATASSVCVLITKEGVEFQ